VSDQTQAQADESELISLHDAPEEAPGRRTSKRKIALAIVGASALAATLTLGPTAWRMLAQRSATITAPPAVGEFARDDSESAKTTAADLMTTLQAQIDVSNAASAVYTDPATGITQSVMFAGGTTFLFSPERDLDVVLGAGDTTPLTQIDPGPLGGVMKCVEGGAPTETLTICGWADHGSIAIVLFPQRSTADAQKLMHDFRSAIQSR
jgi:hypothetical protein